MKRELVVATCQFPVSGDIKKNLSFILKLVTDAYRKGADVAHFSESSLSGYAGTDFKAFAEQDEALLKRSLKQITELSAKLKM